MSKVMFDTTMYANSIYCTGCKTCIKSWEKPKHRKECHSDKPIKESVGKCKRCGRQSGYTCCEY